MSEIIDKLYLELSTVSTATTAKELAMQAEIDELRAFIGDLPEAQNDLLKINKANMAEIARLKELLGQSLVALKGVVSCIEHSTEFQLGNPAYEQAECLGKETITNIEKEGIK